MGHISVWALTEEQKFSGEEGERLFQQREQQKPKGNADMVRAVWWAGEEGSYLTEDFICQISQRSASAISHETVTIMFSPSKDILKEMLPINSVRQTLYIRAINK